MFTSSTAHRVGHHGSEGSVKHKEATNSSETVVEEPPTSVYVNLDETNF